MEGRFEESTQEFIIEQIGDQIVDLPALQSMPEIIEVPAVTCTALSPRIEYVAPAPTDTFAAPAPETGHVTLAFERVEEQIVDVPFPSMVEVIAEGAQIIPPERSLQRTVEHLVDAPVPQVVEEQLVAEETTQFVDELSSEELSVLEFQVEVDRCVLVPKREKEKLSLLEEYSFIPPRGREELRRAIQAGKDALAVAVRELHAFREQSDLWKRRRIWNPNTSHP